MNNHALLLIGAPGSGKGTQAKMLEARLGLIHLSTGDILRTAVRNQTPVGLKAKSFMDQGALVPDEIMLQILVAALSEERAKRGFILDGFPRTLHQAQALDDRVEISHVLELFVPTALLEERITGRRMSPAGHVYHVAYNPPKVEGICDITGEVLYQRADDTSEKVRPRLEAFTQNTQPVIAHYEAQNKVIRIDGVGEPSEVHTRILAAL